MASEKCVRCGDISTPWEMREELGGHICYDCHFILQGVIPDDEESDFCEEAD